MRTKFKNGKKLISKSLLKNNNSHNSTMSNGNGNGSTTTNGNGKKKYNYTKKTGRPSKYKEEYVEQVFKLCAMCGATKDIIAEFFGVGTTTIEVWMDGYEKFKGAIEKGRWEHDSKKVTKSLLERAMGYEWDEIKEEAIVLFKNDKEEYFVEQNQRVKVGTSQKGNPMYRNEKVLVEGVKRTITHKKVPSSDLAIFFWLCNRQPDSWKNVQRQIVEQDGPIIHKHEYDLKKLPINELEDIRKKLEKAKADDEASDSKGSGQRPRLRIA